MFLRVCVLDETQPRAHVCIHIFNGILCSLVLLASSSKIQIERRDNQRRSQSTTTKGLSCHQTIVVAAATAAAPTDRHTHRHSPRHAKRPLPVRVCGNYLVACAGSDVTFSDGRACAPICLLARAIKSCERVPFRRLDVDLCCAPRTSGCAINDSCATQTNKRIERDKPISHSSVCA